MANGRNALHHRSRVLCTHRGSTRKAWLRGLLHDSGYQGDDLKPTLNHGDNQGSLALAENPTHHQRSKHIDIQYHFIREEVGKGNVPLNYVTSNKMVADGLIKGLSGPKHSEFVGDSEWRSHSKISVLYYRGVLKEDYFRSQMRVLCSWTGDSDGRHGWGTEDKRSQGERQQGTNKRRSTQTNQRL